MSTAEDTRWIEPYAGLTYREREMIVDPANETRLIKTCGIDEADFGGMIDPSTFISIAIHEGVLNGVHANGTVNMAQRLIQHEPIPSGEPIIVTGKILDVQPVPRGNVSISETWFARKNGARAITSRRNSLRPDASKVGTRGAGEKPEVAIEDAMALREIGTVTLTPEMVKEYGRNTTNRIHFDPEAAARGGFRAPIIGGGMGVRYLTAEMFRRFKPRELDLNIAFRRPIFWDDTVRIRVAENGGQWTAICLEKDGKVATEVRINNLKAG